MGRCSGVSSRIRVQDCCWIADPVWDSLDLSTLEQTVKTGPPEGVEVNQSLDRLQIVFPRRREATVMPPQVYAEGWRWLNKVPLWQSIPLMLVVYASVFFVSAFSTTWTTVLLMLLMAVAVTGLMVLSYWKGTPKESRSQDQIVIFPRAEVALSPHLLCIKSQGVTTEFLTETIEKVTNDRAGARIRSGGRTHYLLPNRSKEERTWLAGILSERDWRAPCVDSQAERARLETLLKR